MDVTTTDKCRLFYYRKLDTGALEQITDGNGDNDWEFVSLTKNVLTIDRDYIGHEQTYVVKHRTRRTVLLHPSRTVT